VASSSKNYFAELDTFTSDPTAGDALDEWLSSPPLGTVADPISWWTAMDAAGHPLARMALDFLSTPGRYAVHCHLRKCSCQFVATSTDCERAFSRGGLTVSKMRHSLSDESVRAATVLGSWCSLPDAIPREEIIMVFRDKSKRAKGKQPAAASTPASDHIVVDSD
jgi:hypothetical protein